jgi:predicted ArsR family transcriptional regulator
MRHGGYHEPDSTRQRISWRYRRYWRRQYVKKRRQVSLRDVALHFDVEPDAIRGMLDFWVNKGKISRHGSDSACAGGCACSFSKDRELYTWNSQLGEISIEIKSLGDA